MSNVYEVLLPNPYVYKLSTIILRPTSSSTHHNKVYKFFLSQSCCLPTFALPTIILISTRFSSHHTEGLQALLIILMSTSSYFYHFGIYKLLVPSIEDPQAHKVYKPTPIILLSTDI